MLLPRCKSMWDILDRSSWYFEFVARPGRIIAAAIPPVTLNLKSGEWDAAANEDTIMFQCYVRISNEISKYCTRVTIVSIDSCCPSKAMIRLARLGYLGLAAETPGDIAGGRRTARAAIADWRSQVRRVGPVPRA